MPIDSAVAIPQYPITRVIINAKEVNNNLSCCKHNAVSIIKT